MVNDLPDVLGFGLLNLLGTERWQLDTRRGDRRRKSALVRPRQRLAHGPVELANGRSRLTCGDQICIDVFDLMEPKLGDGHLGKRLGQEFDRDPVAVRSGGCEVRAPVLEPPSKYLGHRGGFERQLLAQSDLCDVRSERSLGFTPRPTERPRGVAPLVSLRVVAAVDDELPRAVASSTQRSRHISLLRSGD